MNMDAFMARVNEYLIFNSTRSSKKKVYKLFSFLRKAV